MEVTAATGACGSILWREDVGAVCTDVRRKQLPDWSAGRKYRSRSNSNDNDSRGSGHSIVIVRVKVRLSHAMFIVIVITIV